MDLFEYLTTCYDGFSFLSFVIFPIVFRVAKITYNLAFLSAIGLNNFLQIDLLVPEKKIFKGFFLPYMGMVAILVM